MERDLKLDILKAIGIILVILAHTAKEKNIIFHIRNFDVVLLVLVSSLLFSRLNETKKDYSKNYFLKRIKRIAFPAWIFLVFFFIVYFFIYKYMGLEYFNSGTILLSFFFAEGLPCVWILRVFILISLSAVFLLKIQKKLKSKWSFLVFLAVAYLVYEFLIFLYINSNLSPIINSLHAYHIIDSLFFCFIPYSLLFGFGMILNKLTKKEIIFFILVFLSIFLFSGYYLNYNSDTFVTPQDYKLPPRIYFFSYGLLASLILYLLITPGLIKIVDSRPVIKKTIVFISTASLWIYLWHIFYFYLLDLPIYIFESLSSYPYLLFFVVLILSMFSFYIQKRLVLRIIEHLKLNKKNSERIFELFIK